ncbi:energy transducer TonB [Chryseobacterium sp. SSA4.19]|uniref:energy transducer TonB n=1 Tax=Chryseobacterium sp. SSA4.19 TaxID=2919915 RepID=UPI001F4EA514|nr:energy transducer TonB [Chryseobacterium sp. SSA4.19]MCJ8152193.1 energy transducer TonB [Chryseobacterium sp. SSA4.19]
MNGYEGTVRTEVTFVIEKDGSISDVKAIGINGNFNEEAIRVIKSIKTKWIPAKINSERVRYFYKLPLSMTFN